MVNMTISPMLAKKGDKSILGDSDFLLDPKFDGIRAIVYLEGNTHRIINRSMIDITTRFPELNFPSCQAILDGEIYITKNGVPNFQLMQQRMNRKRDIEEYSYKLPAKFAAFDILMWKGRYLNEMPLIARKNFLENEFPEFACDYVADPNEQENFYRHYIENGWEGVMAKEINSIYLPGKRSSDWLKLKARIHTTCEVVGMTWGTGRRENLFGALVCNKNLLYFGEVGTGFSDLDLQEVFDLVKSRKAELPVQVETKKFVQQWCRPFTIKVSYLELTNEGIMRFPVYEGLY